MLAVRVGEASRFRRPLRYSSGHALDGGLFDEHWVTPCVGNVEQCEELSQTTIRINKPRVSRCSSCAGIVRCVPAANRSALHSTA